MPGDKQDFVGSSIESRLLDDHEMRGFLHRDKWVWCMPVTFTIVPISLPHYLEAEEALSFAAYVHHIIQL